MRRRDCWPGRTKWRSTRRTAPSIASRLNEKGEMSAVTTTSGMAWKIPGRCGDSPIIGGGLWLDQDVGGAGSTGRGEENLRVCGAHTVVENMRHGMSPKDAMLDALKRVARNFDNDREAAGGSRFEFLRAAQGWRIRRRIAVGPARARCAAAQFAVCTGGWQEPAGRFCVPYWSGSNLLGNSALRYTTRVLWDDVCGFR